MAKIKYDISYGKAQERLSEDDSLRIRYKEGTPLEGVKIIDSQPMDLFPSSHNIENQQVKIVDSQTVELSSSAQKVAVAKQKEQKYHDFSYEGKNTSIVYEDKNMEEGPNILRQRRIF
ncbi:hypothetical protein CQW23_07107 [Capsicum baccatum]|uniref:Uncharacterized protein n=1 Tax=Capsicum baccatum TaxID=33114 RepID=A0A2G2X564_CAPBA|nr:hypothetical protein CQW23_07107 [Capsicum baccatum]